VTAASDSNTAASCHPTGTAVHVKWPQLVLKVAPLLGVNVDFLMRHYVVELYTSGQDKIAEEVQTDCITSAISFVIVCYSMLPIHY